MSISITGSESKYKSFGEYFERYYAKRCTEWAYCFRQDLGVNTTMNVERHHRTFKEHFLKGKANTRLDSLLRSLIDYTESLKVQQNQQQLLPRVTHREREIFTRHRRAKAMNVKWQIINESATSCEFTVLSTDGKTEYNVSIDTETCNRQNCRLSCRMCKLCMHMSRCTCPDYRIRSNLCKHIHYICLSRGVKPQYACVAKNSDTLNMTDDFSCDAVNRETLDDENHEQSIAIRESNFNKLLDTIDKIVSVTVTSKQLQFVQCQMDNILAVVSVMGKENYSSEPVTTKRKNLPQMRTFSELSNNKRKK